MDRFDGFGTAKSGVRGLSNTNITARYNQVYTDLGRASPRLEEQRTVHTHSSRTVVCDSVDRAAVYRTAQMDRATLTKATLLSHEMAAGGYQV
jgi:hypothetical protein